MPRIRDHMDDILEAHGYFRKHVAREPNALSRAVADVIFQSQQHNADIVSRALDVCHSCVSEEPQSLDNTELSEDEQEGSFDGFFSKRHRDVRVLADLFQMPFHLLESSDPSTKILCIPPKPPGAMFRPPLELKELLASEENCQPPSPLLRDKYNKASKRRPRKARGNKRGKKASFHEAVTPDTELHSLNDAKPVFLCFSGGVHYDPVYPISMINNAGMVQSILYELLYDKVTYEQIYL